MNTPLLFYLGVSLVFRGDSSLLEGNAPIFCVRKTGVYQSGVNMKGYPFRTGGELSLAFLNVSLRGPQERGLSSQFPSKRHPQKKLSSWFP